MISSKVRDSEFTTDNVWVTTFFIEASAIILANLLTIITFTINRHLRKRSMYCVINLAVADMLVGIEVLVNYALLAFEYRLNQYSLRWIRVSYIVMEIRSMWSLVLVAVERMCAVVWPLRHRNARHWAYTLAISMTWTAAVISGVLTGVVIETTANHARKIWIKQLLHGLEICLELGVICVSYIVIFIQVKQQQQQMAGQRISRRDKGLAMTLFIVTVASIGTWIPLVLVSLLTARGVIVVSNRFLVGFNLLAFSSSLVNPIINVFRMKDFRKALLHLILTCSRDRPAHVVPRPN